MSVPARLPVLVVVALSLGPACTGNPTVSFEVVLPDSVESTAQWLEVGVVSGGCPAAAELAGGLPASGLLDHVAFEKGDTNPPAIGAIAKGSYAFVAAARAVDCSVIATGCASVDVDSARDVTIEMTATSPALGACETGTTCNDARCVPELGGTNTALGADCSLSLVGAGPLGDPLGAAVDVVSTPAVTATDSGFLLAYREYDQMGGMAQLTLIAVDSGGAETLAPEITLPQQCADQDETDAVGIGFASGSAVVASARPTCGMSAGGFDLIQVDPTGNMMDEGFSQSPAGAPALSSSHALAVTGASAGWLAFVESGHANVVALSGLGTAGSPTVFGGGSSESIAQVVTTSQAAALLAGGMGGGDDASTGTPTLEIALGPAPDKTAMPVSFPGDWGAVTAQNSRAIVLSDSSAQGQPLAWRAFDPSSSSPPSGTFAPPASGTVAGGDAVLQGNYAVFAIEQPGAISLVAFDNASTKLTPLRSVVLADDPRVPSQSNVADGKVVVAASATQVMVVWATETVLGTNDAVGGFALYACSN